MSAATVRTVTFDGGEVTYESDMPMRALRGVMTAGTSSNLDLLIDSLAMFVVSWTFPGDPATVDAWDDLKRSDFNTVIAAIVTDLGELGKA